MFDIIRIHNISANTMIGLFAHERLHKQSVRVHIILYLQQLGCRTPDDITYTVDYQQIYDAVIHLLNSSHCYLIERLALDIAQRCVTLSSLIEQVDVTVEKLQALENGARASFQLKRERKELI